MSDVLVILLKGYPRLSETFVAQEVLGLERAGFAIRLASMRRPTDGKLHPVHREIRAGVDYLCEYLHHEPLRVFRAFVKVRGRPGFRPAWRAFVRDLWRDRTANRVRRFGQALVLAAEWPTEARFLYAHFIHTPASVARYASLLLGVPWACSAHAKDIWTTPDWDLAQKLRDAAWVVTCTKAGRERLAALAPARDVRLLYHGLDLRRFAPYSGARPPRDGTQALEPVRLLTVGRAVEKKGLDVLLAALADLSPALHWRWTHIGGGPLLAGLKAHAEQLGLSGRLSWRGAQDQEAVLSHYRDADVFVLPSRIARDGDRDGLPNVLMEAQSQGLPCLSSRVAAIPELVESEVSGLLVAPEDPAALAAALTRLIGDPALRRRLGLAGAWRVRNGFDHLNGIDRLAARLEASGVIRVARKVATP